MCEGFGIIYTKDGRVLFIAPTYKGQNMTHSSILKEANLPENTDKFIRSFVRVQYKNWNIESFQIDEPGTLPGWVEEDFETIKQRCNKTLNSVLSALEVFENKIDAIYNERDVERIKAGNEYHKKVKSPYIDMTSSEWKIYSDKCMIIHDAICMREDNARNEYLDKLSKIPGYLSCFVKKEN